MTDHTRPTVETACVAWTHGGEPLPDDLRAALQRRGIEVALAPSGFEALALACRAGRDPDARVVLLAVEPARLSGLDAVLDVLSLHVPKASAWAYRASPAPTLWAYEPAPRETPGPPVSHRAESASRAAPVRRDLRLVGEVVQASEEKADLGSQRDSDPEDPQIVVTRAELDVLLGLEGGDRS